MKKTNPSGEVPRVTEVLPPKVAAEYQVTPGVLQKFLDSELGEVDLSTLTLEFAERVAARGYLKRIRQPAGS